MVDMERGWDDGLVLTSSGKFPKDVPGNLFRMLFYCTYDIKLWAIGLHLVTVEQKLFNIMWK